LDYEGTRIGSYSIGRRIGEGACAVVHETVQESTGRPCAIKIFAEELVDGDNFYAVLQTIQAEPSIMAKLDEHKNIVRVIDAGDDRGLYYVVMELMDGSLKDKVLSDGIHPLKTKDEVLSDGVYPLKTKDEIGRLSMDEVLWAFTEVCEGLNHMHKHGYVHQDIKPGNLLIRKDEQGKIGEVKISDLGTAMYLSKHGTRVSYEGVFAYTEGYVDPRILLRREKPSAQSDIYSLGVTFYQILTGEFPPERRGGEIVRPIEFNKEIPARMDKLILRMLSEEV